MQKYFYIVIHLLALVLTLGVASSANAEVVRSSKSVVRLLPDSTLDVAETITYDFQNDERYGLYRFIDLTNTYDGHAYKIKIRVLRVLDGNGKRLKYSTDILQNRLKISVKETGKLISGVHTYQIHYRVMDAVDFSRKIPRLYWNASGYQWIVPVQHVTVQFSAPPNVTLSEHNFAAFRGSNDAIKPVAFQHNNSSFTFEGEDFPKYHGLSFAVDLPSEAVVVPTIGKVLLWNLVRWWPALLLPLIAVSVIVTLYWRGGRDADIGLARGVEWKPPSDLTPAEFGTLIDEQCNVRDIIATLFHLAARGYLRIFEEKCPVPQKNYTIRDYAIARNASDPPGDTLNSFEMKLLEAIFKYAKPQLLSRYLELTDASAADPHIKKSLAQVVLLSRLPETFRKEIREAGDEVYRILTRKGYFQENPLDSRWKVLLVGGALGIVSFFLWGNWRPWSIGFLLSGLAAYLSHRAMPAKTSKGVKKLRECQGFARYVHAAEKARWEKLSQQDPRGFGEWLPYAVVLSVKNEWLLHFESLLLSYRFTYDLSNSTARELVITHDILTNLKLDEKEIYFKETI